MTRRSGARLSLGQRVLRARRRYEARSPMYWSHSALVRLRPAIAQAPSTQWSGSRSQTTMPCSVAIAASRPSGRRAPRSPMPVSIGRPTGPAGDVEDPAEPSRSIVSSRRPSPLSDNPCVIPLVLGRDPMWGSRALPPSSSPTPTTTKKKSSSTRRRPSPRPRPARRRQQRRHPVRLRRPHPPRPALLRMSTTAHDGLPR